MPAVETRNLTKIYRTYRKEAGLWGAVKGLYHREYDEVRAADGVSFSIEEGELVGFLGPNGAGKTTVLKMLSGLLNPSGSAGFFSFWGGDGANGPDRPAQSPSRRGGGGLPGRAGPRSGD